MGTIRRNGLLLVAVLALTVQQAGRAEEAGRPCRGAAAGDDCARDPCEPTVFPTPPRFPWYFQADALALRRDVHGATDVASLNTPENIVLSTRDFDEPFKGGARLLLGRTFGDSPFQVECSYFATDQLNASAAIRDVTPNIPGGGTTGNLFSPFTKFGNPAVEGADYNTFVSIQESSTLQNGELNVRRLLPLPPGRFTGSILVGARYMQIGEQFDYFSESQLPPGGSTNAVQTRTRNELWGPQIGVLLDCYIEDQWWVNFGIKGAICNNSAFQETRYVNTGSTALSGDYYHSRSGSATTYLGDLHLTFVYRWTPNFTVRIGYQAIWVQGLVLASENFHPSLEQLRLGPAEFKDTGKTVYHGPHLGAELAW
jgi:hypothetical protein